MKRILIIVFSLCLIINSLLFVIAVNTDATRAELEPGAGIEAPDPNAGDHTEDPDVALDSEAEDPGGAPDGEAENPDGALDGEAEDQDGAPDDEAEDQDGVLDGEAEDTDGVLDGEAEDPDGVLDGEAKDPSEAPDGEAKEPGGALDKDAVKPETTEELGSISGFIWIVSDENTDPEGSGLHNGAGQASTSGPAAESAAEPATGPAAESTAEPATGPTAESAAEPATGPAAESAAEPATGPTAESAAEPATGPATESVAEPATGPTTDSPTESETGSATGSDNEPVVGYKVSLFSATDLTLPLAQTWTDEDGAYEFTLKQGEYVLSIETDIIDDQEYGLPTEITEENKFESDPGAPMKAFTETIELASGQAVKDINASLQLLAGATKSVLDDLATLPLKSTVKIDSWDWYLVRRADVGSGANKITCALLFKTRYAGGAYAFGTSSTTSNYTGSLLQSRMEDYYKTTSLPTIKASAVKPSLGDHSKKETLSYPTTTMAGSTTKDIFFAPSIGDYISFNGGENGLIKQLKDYGQRIYSRTYYGTLGGNVYGVNPAAGGFDYGIHYDANYAYDVPAVWVKVNTDPSAVQVTVKYVNMVNTLIGSPNTQTYTVNYGEAFSLPSSEIPSIPNYTYSQWKNGENGTPQSTAISVPNVTQPTTIYLMFSKTDAGVERYQVSKAPDVDIIIDTYHWLADAVVRCGSDGTYYITATENDDDMSDNNGAYVQAPINPIYKKIAVTIPGDRTIVLRSAGSAQYTITQLSSARHLTVNGHLTLENVELDGSGAGGGALVNGTLVMGDGAVIRDCYAADNGGGVSVTANGTLTMDRGSLIHGNIARKSGANGDSINGYGGGVYVVGGTLTMNSGSTISGNTANTGTKDGAGGGVFVDGGTMTMEEESEISGNFAATGTKVAGTYASGGGVYIKAGSKNSTFTMNGGTISGNYAGYNSFGTGGGVYVYGASNDPKNTNTATFSMANGTISDNTAGRSGYGTGGGVNVMNGGIFSMSGGAVTHNNASVTSSNTDPSVGGGVNITGGIDTNNKNFVSKFTMTGSAVVSYNISSVNGPSVGEGGGVFVKDGSFVMSGNTSISYNAASTGAGIAGNGGGVFVVRTNNATSTFTMSGSALINDNYASANGKGYGGGIYVSNGTELKVYNPAQIKGNTALHGEGGGIFSEGHDYATPKTTVDPAKYAPIVWIDKTVVFSGNRATDTYPCPTNAASVTRFEGTLLNNDDINFISSAGRKPHSITYMANNGTDVFIIDPAIMSGGKDIITVKSPSELGFTGPAGIPRFAGWNTESGGNGEAYTAGEIRQLTGNVVVYAIWQRIPIYSITISKEVAGAFGDLTQEFSFEASFYEDAAGSTPLDHSSPFSIVDTFGNLGSLALVNNVGSFTLKHGQSITILGVPDGCYINIRETGVLPAVYEVTCTDDLNAGIEISHTGSTAKFLHPQQIVEDQTFSFINDLIYIAPTGIALGDPWAMLQLPVLMLLLAFLLPVCKAALYRQKKR